MFKKNDKIKLLHDVETVFIDPKGQYPGIDYEEYAHLQSKIVLKQGTIALFFAYQEYLPELHVMQVISKPGIETDFCIIKLGRNKPYLIDVKTKDITNASLSDEITTLDKCVDSNSLPEGHYFLEDSG